MPNRILREGINSSVRVNQLSVEAEVFYRRLMSAVDDYGRTEALVELLLARLYPLKVLQISVSDLAEWIDECISAGLMTLYVVDSKAFIELVDFNQQKRAKASKCPSPEKHMLCTCYASATHVISNAHLGVCVCGGEGVCVYCSEVDEPPAEPPPAEPDEEEPETTEPDSPVVLTYPCSGGKGLTYDLTQAKLDEYEEAFPGIDVFTECKKALQWCRDNPRRKKTPTGMPRFLGAWLGKEQNSVRTGNSGSSDWPIVRDIVKQQWTPDYDNTLHLKAMLSDEQFAKAKHIGFRRISDATVRQDSTLAAEYAQAGGQA